MSLHGRAIGWVTRGFVGVDDAYRAEVAATTHELAADLNRWGRAAEVASLAGLALRLRWRHRTAGRVDVTWRQGLFLGGLLLLCAWAARWWARAAAPDTAWPAVGTAAGLSSALALALCAHARFGVGGSRTRVSVALAAAAVPVAAYPAALVLGAGVTADACASALTLVGPVFLLAVGRHDPRWAAAALVLWFSRLVAGDLAAFARAFATPGDEERMLLLARWFLMASGVLVAWLVAHRSIRRLNHV
ncbi:hypothetical protein OG216_15480 [Streptomycetaceae bacterium NBC_01309]